MSIYIENYDPRYKGHYGLEDQPPHVALVRDEEGHSWIAYDTRRLDAAALHPVLREAEAMEAAGEPDEAWQLIARTIRHSGAWVDDCNGEQPAYHTLLGRHFQIIEQFADTPEGRVHAHRYLEQYPYLGVAGIAEGRILIARNDDRGIDAQA